MKRIFTSAVILLGVAITYAQSNEGRVGVNTDTPAAIMKNLKQEQMLPPKTWNFKMRMDKNL